MKSSRLQIAAALARLAPLSLGGQPRPLANTTLTAVAGYPALQDLE